MSADNQQERSNDNICHYLAGFVDGEGSFHIAIQKRTSVRFGWQIIPEFRVSQHKDRLKVLRLLKLILKCGFIRPNHRNGDENYVYVVRNRNDLYLKIIPFFQKFFLRSEKQKDFKKFAIIVEKMYDKKHLIESEFVNLLKIAFSMNRKGKYRNKYTFRFIIRNPQRLYAKHLAKKAGERYSPSSSAMKRDQQK